MTTETVGRLELDLSTPKLATEKDKQKKEYQNNKGKWKTHGRIKTIKTKKMKNWKEKNWSWKNIEKRSKAKTIT